MAKHEKKEISSELGTVPTVTRTDVRKVVNKVFAVTIGNVDAYRVCFTVASTVKIDSTVNLSLLSGWMSSI